MASRAATTKGNLHWTRNRGRDGWSVPTDVADDMTTEAVNVVLEKNTLGRKRRGSKTQPLTGTFTGYASLALFVPRVGGEKAAEIYFDSVDRKIMRVANGTNAVALTMVDPELTGNVSAWAQLNNKLYVAYDSAVNRLHVIAPDENPLRVRRVGLSLPGVPGVANTPSAGTYEALIRYYRTQWRARVGAGQTLARQSNLSPVVAFTPDGAHTGVRITQPTPPNDGETHWAVYGSADDEIYYELAEQLLPATFYDDLAPRSTYITHDESPDEGAFTPWPSVKFLLSTGERLVGFGVYETAAGDSVVPKNGRVYFSPVLDTTEYDDDERVSNSVDFQGWIDIARNAGGEDRALGGPIDNNIFVFQSRGTYMLVPTGQAESPYRRMVMHPRIGAVSHESTFMGEDETGAPALYWLDPIRGPYRYGAKGMEWCGYDVQDVWPTVNLTASVKVAIGVYDPELRACIWGIATGASHYANELIVFFVREGQSTTVEGVRGGMVRWQETAPSVFQCVALLPEIIGGPMSPQLKPYLGSATVLNRWNDETVQTDAGAAFRAYVKSKAFTGRLDQRTRFGKSYVQTTVGAGVSILQALTRNFGDETPRTATVVTTPVGAETRMIRKFEAAGLADAQAIQVLLGDAAPADNTWTIDEWFATIEPTEEA